jgi:NADH-quinone oxidoreductase subunit N
MNDLLPVLYRDLRITAPLSGVMLLGLVLIVVHALKRDSEPLQFALALLGLAANAVLACLLFPFHGTAFQGMLSVGGYASVTTVLFLVSAGLTITLARAYLKKIGIPFPELYILVVFAASGMMVFAASLDLIATFLGLEILSISLYVLAGMSRRKILANEASLKYFLLGAFASGFFLYGIALMYGMAQSTNLQVIAAALPRLSGEPLFLLGAGLLAVGFAFKVGAAPFHFWVPDVYQGSPTVVTGFMASGAKASAFAALAMVFVLTVNLARTPMTTVFALLAAATMVLGNLVALAQTNVKRMLAYSSVAHAGYLLIAIATATHDAMAGMLFYLSAYMVTSIGAFGIVGLVENAEQEGTDLAQFRGLGRRHPLLGALLSLFLFSLIGLPPFAGFFGKYYVFYAAIVKGLTWLTIVGVVTSMISLYYYLRVIVSMYFEGDGDGAAPALDMASRVALLLCAAAVLVFGFFPQLLFGIFSSLPAGLSHP